MNEDHTRNGYIPIITVILIILNGIVFIIQTFRGGSENTEALIKMGAAYTPLILENGEWYRLFAPMFLHIGVQKTAEHQQSSYFINIYRNKKSVFACFQAFFG